MKNPLRFILLFLIFNLTIVQSLLSQESCEVLKKGIDSAYMGMVRNLQRYGWIIPYLFGASPAVCKSFFGDKAVTMLEFDKGTFYEPYATSLRMSDIGYQNQKEESVGIKANYDSLQSYIESLRCAIETPAPLWEMIGLKDADGAWRQLNTNILQIENEYYSTVRPKQVLQGMEKPVSALQRRGIRYIELRSLDVNAFEPLGINETQLNFLEIFLLACLLQESPAISMDERAEIEAAIADLARRAKEKRIQPAELMGGITVEEAAPRHHRRRRRSGPWTSPPCGAPWRRTAAAPCRFHCPRRPRRPRSCATTCWTSGSGP